MTDNKMTNCFKCKKHRRCYFVATEIYLCSDCLVAFLKEVSICLFCALVALMLAFTILVARWFSV